MNRSLQKGFTLIELMIVVAIIGILAAVALPAYQNYIVKAKIGSVLSSMASLKTSVGVCIQEAGGTPDNCNTTASAKITSIPAFTATKEIASATVAAGVITATLGTGINKDVDNGVITFTPTPNETSIIWKNTYATLTNATAIELIVKNNI